MAGSDLLVSQDNDQMATKPSDKEKHPSAHPSQEQKGFSLPVFSSSLITGGYPGTSRHDSQSWRQALQKEAGPPPSREVIASSEGPLGLVNSRNLRGGSWGLDLGLVDTVFA